MRRTLFLFLVLGACQLSTARPANFIQILTDDQGWEDLHSYGRVELKTPHIDQLAADGIRFTDCYSSSGVCSPSRAAILTGRTPYRNGVSNWLNTGREMHLLASEVTLPQLLRKNGYQTAHFGKWHLSHYENAGKSHPTHVFGGEKADPPQPTMEAYGYDYWFATGNITQIDEAVGAIVRSLDAAGLTDNTLVWYTSDNGPAGDDEHNPKTNFRGSTGGHRGRKAHTYEGGIRVPGIIKWPTGFKAAGLPVGSVSAEPIIGHDIFPTLLEIAGIPLPSDRVIDGASILPVFEKMPVDRERPLYWRNRKDTMRVAIREGDWKLLCDSPRSTWELYNVAEDPGETTDRSQSHPERLEQMKAALIAYDNDVLTDGPDWWQQGAWRKSFPPEIVKAIEEKEIPR